jgi:hypothetical protein
VDAARDAVLTECEHQPHVFAKCISILSKEKDPILNLPNLPKEQPLEKEIKKLSELNLQDPWGVTEADLAPHVDLQLQPPSQLLLELLLLKLQSDEADAAQFQQRYRLDAEQMDGLGFLMAADETFGWMHQIAQQVQQQQQGGTGQQQQAGQQNRCNGSAADAAAAQPAPAAAAAGVWQVLGQLHQQRDNHPHTADLLQQLPAATDAASLAANLVQLLAQGSIGEDGGSSALNQSTLRQVVLQLRVLGGALVLQFVCAARAAGGPAWQQEVPLQAVVLFGALEQMQGMALAYLDSLHVVSAAAEVDSSDTKRLQQQQNNLQANGCQRKAADAATSSRSSSPSLQQPQQPDADAVSSDSNDSSSSSSLQQAGSAAAHSQPCGALMRVVRKLQGLLQLLRQFCEANAALNAAAAADPSADAVAAREVLPVTPKRGLAACELFCPASPLLYTFPEPCGHGIWAPAVAATIAAAAAAGEEAQAQPGSNSSSSSDSSWAAGNGSSSRSASHWFNEEALAALAGAGVLSQRAHVLLAQLHTGLATADLQQKLVEEVVQTLQMLSRCSKREEQLFGLRQQQQQQELSGPLQQLQQVCQQHGVELPAELLQQLSEVPATVLHCAFSELQQVADASGVDLQQSSSFRHSWNRREVPAIPGEAAIKEGKQALW